MFEFLKKIVGKPAGEQTGGQTLSNPKAPTSATAKAESRFAGKPHGGNGSGRGTVEIPLDSVLSNLPLELKGRVKRTDVAGATMSISVSTVLAQLPSGAVKISFGDLRRAAPQLFSAEKDRDQIMVALPLGEILAQVNLSSLSRRPNQKHVDVPEEIQSPFGDRGKGLVFAVGPTKPGMPTPPARSVTPAAPVPPTSTPAPPAQQTKPLPSAQTRPGQSTSHQTSFKAKSFQPAPVQPPVQPKPIQMPSVPQAPFQQKPGQFPATKPGQFPATKPGQLPATKPGQPAAIQPQVKPAAPITPPLPRPSIQSTPTPPPPTAAPIAPAPAIPLSNALRNLAGPFTPMTPVAPIAAPVISPNSIAPAAPITPIAPAGLRQTSPVSTPAPEPEVQEDEGERLLVSLGSLAEGWPEPLKDEILQANLQESSIALPVSKIGAALKQGRVSFQWRVLRSWLTPEPASGDSAQDGTSVELPLRVIAPLFLAHQREVDQARQKVAIDESIPNLFFGFPQAEGGPASFETEPAVRASQPAAPTAAPVAVGQGGAKPFEEQETNFYVWDDNSDSARVDETEFKRKGAGTEFVTRYATPNEIVSRAGALEGVVGALIALPDGLMVASRLSSDLNADTLAAFLPHIFAKVSQCTKELRMGDLNNLNFTVGNVPWKIFRVNAIFFAAFGRAGQALPTAQLCALAAELDHKKP